MYRMDVFLHLTTIREFAEAAAYLLSGGKADYASCLNFNIVQAQPRSVRAKKG